MSWFRWPPDDAQGKPRRSYRWVYLPEPPQPKRDREPEAPWSSPLPWRRLTRPSWWPPTLAWEPRSAAFRRDSAEQSDRRRLAEMERRADYADRPTQPLPLTPRQQQEVPVGPSLRHGAGQHTPNTWEVTPNRSFPDNATLQGFNRWFNATPPSRGMRLSELARQYGDYGEQHTPRIWGWAPILRYPDEETLQEPEGEQKTHPPLQAAESAESHELRTDGANEAPIPVRQDDPNVAAESPLPLRRRDTRAGQTPRHDGPGGEDGEQIPEFVYTNTPIRHWPEQPDWFIEEGLAPPRWYASMRAAAEAATRGEPSSAVDEEPAAAAEGLEPVAEGEPAGADGAPATDALAPGQQARRPIIRGSKPYPTEASLTPVLSRICTNIWIRNGKSIEPKLEDAWVELAKVATANGVKAIGKRALEDRMREFYGSWTGWLVKWRALNGL